MAQAAVPPTTTAIAVAASAIRSDVAMVPSGSSTTGWLPGTVGYAGSGVSGLVEVQNLGTKATTSSHPLRFWLAGERGGRLYLEFLARFGDDGYARDLHVKRRRPRLLVAELEQAGATIVHRETIRTSDSCGSFTAAMGNAQATEWPKE